MHTLRYVNTNHNNGDFEQNGKFGSLFSNCGRSFRLRNPDSAKHIYLYFWGNRLPIYSLSFGQLHGSLAPATAKSVVAVTDPVFHFTFFEVVKVWLSHTGYVLKFIDKKGLRK